MPKDYRNYIGGLTNLEGYTQRNDIKGVTNIFDLRLGSDVQFTATGGTELEPGNGYKYHVFTSPGNFVVLTGTGDIEILLVAGGGGGGNAGDSATGGGGAGGVGYSTSGYSVGSYPISVGGGGAAGGNNGSNSTFNSGPGALVAAGGGGGGSGPRNTFDPGNPGGSGGGGHGFQAPTPGGTGTQPTLNGGPSSTLSQYGNSGQPGPGSQGGGGGGAGSSGGPSSPNDPRAQAGGIGILIEPGPTPGFYGPVIGHPSLAPLNGYFGGGGGGGSVYSEPSPATHGGGKGATNPAHPPTNAQPGVQYSGGGGGGDWDGGGAGGNGGAGGSGIVIIRYIV